MVRFLAIVVAAIALAACGAAPVRNINHPDNGLVFGQIDLGESDIGVGHVIVKRVDKIMIYGGYGGEKSTHTYTNGAFFTENLKPGTYVVAGIISGDSVYHFQDPQRFTLAAGQIRYGGTYRLRYKKTGLFRFDESSFERADSPKDELRLLKWLEVETKGTDWQPKVRARLKGKK